MLTATTPARLATLAVLLALATASPARAQTLSREGLAQTARLFGDTIIATNCKLRPQSWLVVAAPAISLELERLSKSLDPSGGLDPAHVADVIDGAQSQAIDEGTVQFTRYGQASCKAIQDDGSLARIDALVASFKRPVR